MKWLVFFYHTKGLILIGQYNNYDLECGYMEHSIVSRIKRMFPEAKLQRDEAGMPISIGGVYPVHIISV